MARPVCQHKHKPCNLLKVSEGRGVIITQIPYKRLFSLNRKMKIRKIKSFKMQREDFQGSVEADPMGDIGLVTSSYSTQRIIWLTYAQAATSTRGKKGLQWWRSHHTVKEQNLSYHLVFISWLWITGLSQGNQTVINSYCNMTFLCTKRWH